MGLFGKKTEVKTTPPPPPAADTKKDTTYFGKNLRIDGKVSGQGDVLILGKLEGEVDLRGRLNVAQTADLKGEIRANAISVNGRVRGNLTALEKIHLDQTAKIEGQLRTAKISIVEGAHIEGQLEMNPKTGLNQKR